MTVRSPRRRAPSNRGDLIVEVQVTVPEKLTPEQEEAMKKFAEAMDYKA